MATLLDQKQIEDEVVRATRLAKRVKRPRGVHGISVKSDVDHDGDPMLVISVDVDDDPDPSDHRLDELIDFERNLTRKIWSGDFVSCPTVRFVPRIEGPR